ATGHWTYTADDRANPLRTGDAYFENFNVTAAAANGSAQTTITIEVLGQNDAPRIVGDHVVDVVVDQDHAYTQGTFMVDDPDAFESQSWASADAGFNGHSGFFISPYNGSWSYGADPNWARQLGAGQSV